MIRFLGSPLGRGIQQAAVVLAGFAGLAFSGIVDCDEQSSRNLGPVGPNAPTVADLVIDPAPPNGGFSSNVLQPITFTVKAVDANGGPVRDSQNGITLFFTESVVLADLSDEPDPDNAVVRVTVRPNAPSVGGLIEIRYQNPTGSPVNKSFQANFTHQGARIVVDPAGPLTMLVDQSIPVTATAVDASGNPVQGGDRFIGVADDDVSFVSWADFIADPGEPNGDAVLRGRVVAKRFLLDGEADVQFIMHNPQISTVLPITITNQQAPAGRVIASTPDTRAIPGRDIVLVALVQDAAGNMFPGGEQFVQATSSNTAVATVQGRSEGDPDGIVEFTVRGVAAGNAEIRFTYPGATTAVTTLGVVNAPPGRIVSVASTDEMHVGLTIELTARVQDFVTGAPVPGSDQFITARSSNDAIATVIARNDGVPGDGEVSFTIRGVSTGITSINFSYPGVHDDMTLLTVNP